MCKETDFLSEHFFFFFFFLIFDDRAAGSKAGKTLSKKAVRDQVITSLCEGVLFPQADLSLRLRAVLLQGIVVVFARQAAYLLKDCRDVLRSFHEAVFRTAAPIDMAVGGGGGGGGGAARELALPSAEEHSFFVEEGDVVLGDLEELARGGDFVLGELELVVGDGDASLSMRREDITMLAPVSEGAGGGGGGGGEGVELLGGAGGFEFQFDGGEMDIALAGEVRMGDDSEAHQGTKRARGNELLDQMRFELEVSPGEEKKPRTRRAVHQLADSKTRLEASLLRQWLTDNRISAVARPELAAVKRLGSGKGGDPRALNIGGLAPELTGLFAGIWASLPREEEGGDEEVYDDEEEWRRRRSSVEVGRMESEESAVAMDLGWDESLGGAADQSRESLAARMSGGRMPSVSPARPGRSSVFSEASSEGGGGGGSASDAAARAFMLDIDTPAREAGEEEAPVGDIRTYKLKMVMRPEFEAGGGAISFDQFTASVKSRKALASTFYHLLLLGTSGQIGLHQKSPYGDIVISKQAAF